MPGLDYFLFDLKLFCRDSITWGFSTFSVPSQTHGRAGPGPGSGWWGCLIGTCQDLPFCKGGKAEDHQPLACLAVV